MFPHLTLSIFFQICRVWFI